MNGSDTRTEDMPFISKLAGGACSGISVACVLTPVELIKCRMQTANEGAVRYKSTLDCLFKTVQEGGIRSLFRGFVGTLCREIPGNAGAPQLRPQRARWDPRIALLCVAAARAVLMRTKAAMRGG